MKYEATYHFNVRRHLRVEFEASDPCEAERLARAQAEQHIDAELVAIMNSDGFGETDLLDAHLTLDECGPAGSVVVCEGEPLPLDEDSKNNGR